MDDEKGKLARQAENPGRGCLTVLVFVGLTLVFIGGAMRSYEALQRPIINGLYGPDALPNGLRVVGRSGQLSDGRRLSGGWFAMLALGSFLGGALAAVVYVVIMKAKGWWPEEDSRSGADSLSTRSRKQKAGHSNPVRHTLCKLVVSSTNSIILRLR